MPPEETMRLGSLVERSGLISIQLTPPLDGAQNHLAAVVDHVVVERIDSQRRGPVAAVLRLVGRRIESVQPRADRARDLGLIVVARHFVAVAGGPHDVGVGHVGQGEARFAAAQVVLPGAHAAESAAPPPPPNPPRPPVACPGTLLPASWVVRQSAHGAVVLHVAVDLVRHVVIHGHVIHLADGQGDAAATCCRGRW